MNRATASPQPALVNRTTLRRFGPAGFDQAHLERCEYCGWNRHRCGCEDALTYEQIRDNPTLFAR